MGHGTFKKTPECLILTDKDKNRSSWRFPKKHFSSTKNLFRNRLSWKDKKVFSKRIGIGQEFILNVHDNPSNVSSAS